MAKEFHQQGQGGGSNAGGGGGGGGRERRGRREPGAGREPRSKLYEEDVIRINRVDKVVKGGRRSSFAAFVVLGNGNGSVGYSSGKAKQVPSSIDKAVRLAEKQIFKFPVVNGTIPHPVEGRFGGTRVRLLPASEGTGVIAGRSVRAVLQKLGLRNVLSKKYGSNNPINVVRATFDALSQLRTKEQYEQLRGIAL